MPKILIADDDFSIGMEIEEMLTTTLGYEVVGQAGSGQQAVEMAQDLKPDIILMDVVMPGEMNGIDAAERIKAESNIPIVFISGYGDPEYIEKAKQIEPFGYVMKPFDEEEIRASIEIALYKRKMELKLEKAHERLERTNLGLRGEIAARKKTERALRESEEKLRVIFDTVYSGMILVDATGAITFANRRMAEMFGHDMEEFIGSSYPEHVHETQSDESEQKMLQLIRGDIDHVFMERLYRKKDGTVFWGHLSGSRLCHLDGAFSSLVGVITDVTEKKELEAQLQQAQKMEAIATLAGGVAHEFNNTLMGIMGNIELLQMNFSEDGGFDKYLEPMKSAGHRMSRLAAQLLAYAKGGKYRLKDLKMDHFVIQTLPLLQHSLNPKVRMETHFPKDISYIKADYAQMQMVLSAILTNANEAIEDEGIIRIAAENKDIDEDLAKQHPGLKPGAYVYLTIEDDGKGMDEGTRNGIFEPFFTTKFQGRGMGMAAVHGIVKNHDGWISVASELGKGTTVQIYLPAIEVEVEKPKKAKVEMVTGSGTILMIEDEDVFIEVTQAMLEMLGYRVMVAKTGKEAIHISETFDGQIDLALLDIKLPDIDGRNLYPLIMKARSKLKVIVCSGYSIDGPAREILDAGAQDFIQKPFSLAALSEKLKGVLEGK